MDYSGLTRDCHGRNAGRWEVLPRVDGAALGSLECHIQEFGEGKRATLVDSSVLMGVLSMSL